MKFSKCVYLSLVIGGLAFVVGKRGGVQVWDWHKATELILCISLLALVYLLAHDWGFQANETRIGILETAFRINRFCSSYYSRNLFYCRLMVLTIAVILLGNYHFLNLHEPITASGLPANIHDTAKVWEVAAYAVTFFYTAWFWFVSQNGNILVGWLNKVDDANVMRKIVPALILMFVATAFHFCLVFLPMLVTEGLSDNAVPISMFLIVLVYVSFYLINRTVIAGLTHRCDPTPNECPKTQDGQCKKAKFRREWEATAKAIDYPTLWIFVLLFVYSICLWACTTTELLSNLEIFFSGAIAFELLLSSIVWANTETV
jgi:hypothetical protein